MINQLKQWEYREKSIFYKHFDESSFLITLKNICQFSASSYL